MLNLIIKKLMTYGTLPMKKKILFVFISFFSFFFYAIFFKCSNAERMAAFLFFTYSLIIYFSIIGMDYIFYKLNNVFKLRIFI